MKTRFERAYQPSGEPFVARVWSQAFSLIELLCVVAILSILAALGAVSLVNSGSAKLNAAGNEVVDLINLARQSSMTTGEMIALVMAKDTGDADLNGRSFILLRRGADDEEWRPVTRWTVLPEGVAVESVASQTFTDNLPNVQPRPGPMPNLRGKEIHSTECAYQVFMPTGRLSILDIIYPSNPVLRIVQSEKYGNSPSDNYYEITLDRFSGLARVTRP